MPAAALVLAAEHDPHAAGAGFLRLRACTYRSLRRAQPPPYGFGCFIASILALVSPFRLIR